MYLKNLTVLGFKSFADKTSLNFQPGVTAIVGPNGCGKSNVSDAVRWVLGEQSAKALRGSEMADVIFNGTDGRKPLSMAEVSLTLGAVDQEHLRAAGVELSYDEVTVTRRIFRDGVSEYFINRTPCRLKDIQQLFMGTGMGRASYSIMAQGHITQILSSKPEDRRLIFEEAAGITRFKAQKREALRKLEYTEQNLVRVADLIREVKRQIGSLQRQAGKARRYKQFATQLQYLETQFARHQFDLLQGEIRERETTADTLRGEIEHAGEGIARAEHEIAELRERLLELEHEVGLKQQRGMELKGEADRHESRIQFNEERQRALESQSEKAQTEITQAEERRRAAEEELAAVTGRLANSEAALQQHREALQARQDVLRKTEEELRGKQEALRIAQSRALGGAQDLARVRNELAALDLQKQGNVIRLEKLSAEKVQLEEERTRLDARLNEFALNVESEKLSVQTKRGTVEQRQQRLREVQEELTVVARAQDALVREQAEKRTRLNMLEQLESSHEGFSAAAQTVLRQSQAVIGSLADRIRVPDPYVVAIENALGHNLQVVLTEKPESAQQILADLSASRKGRASVAALEIHCPDDKQLVFAGEMSPDGQGGNANTAPGAVDLQPSVAALEVIQADPTVEPLLRGLLGRTFIVRDLATATASIQNGHAGCDFVTYGGDLLNRHGVYTGGYLNGQGNGRAPSSILGRKNQITELQTRLAQVQEQVNEVSRQRGALQSEQTELQSSLQQAQTELRNQEVAIAARQGEFNALQSSHRMLGQKVETVVYEVQSLAAQDQEGREKREALSARVAELDAAQTALQEEVTALTAGLEGLRTDREAASAALTESRVALATEQQMCASFRQQRSGYEQRLGELAQIVELRRQEIAGCGERREQAQTEIEASRRCIVDLQGQREQVSGEIAELAGRKQGAESEVGTREEALRETRRHLAELQTRRGNLEVELAQKRMAGQNLRERIEQKYHVNLDDIRGEGITITLADEGPPKVQTLTPEEMAAAGLATDWEAVGQQVTALQQKIDEMGPVNLVAIEEYEETEQRYQFLSKQHDDLVTAKAQLLEVLNRINTQTQEMFATTFNQIRDNFRLMFVEVFGGGKADLVLVDENDLLESGIDIVARPPGKQLQSISLLSGGEQTMTAVALLFSIYQVKPSPFCVLDELDAPLDESNINRFVRILQRFIAHSQFVIITHNKRTIGMADVLYGVTMQEHGVSKIVSVKFHKTDEAVPAEQVRPLVAVAGRDVEQEEDAPHQREETLEVAGPN
jgi:chromosome segregation protein